MLGLRISLTLLPVFGMLCGGASAATGQGTPNDVIVWNKTLLSIVRTPGAQPATLHPTRSFALLHAAIYDAVNSIDSRHQPYLVHIEHVSLETSREAAVDAAAHEVLVSLYPAFQTALDAQLQQELAAIPDGPDKASGVSVGEVVAQAILTLRRDDGSAAPPVTLTLGNGPGVYQSTPPNFPKPAFTQWSHVRPFALQRANQFRPGPPPALLSARYTEVFDEVKSLGVAGSVTATADQQLIGRFWGGAIQNYWNEIAQTTAQAHNLSLAGTARLFALLNITLADSVIAFYDAKYTYVFWRPVTAIRAADTDGNPLTTVDTAWSPQAGNTAADPSYPGAHATISAGAQFVLSSFFGRQQRLHLVVTSEVLPGVVRTFDDFADAEQEASVSRIYAGQHFRSDEDAGEVLGREVADFVLDHFLAPMEAWDEEGERGRDDR
jgi:hypothetical protein